MQFVRRTMSLNGPLLRIMWVLLGYLMSYNSFRWHYMDSQPICCYFSVENKRRNSEKCSCSWMNYWQSHMNILQLLSMEKKNQTRQVWDDTRVCKQWWFSVFRWTSCIPVTYVRAWHYHRQGHGFYSQGMQRTDEMYKVECNVSCFRQNVNVELFI